MSESESKRLQSSAMPCSGNINSDNGEISSTSFENVLEELGTIGRYQFIQLFLLCLTMGLTTNVIFSFVFIGYDPSYVCNTVNETEIVASLQLQNDSIAYVSYHPCEIQVHINESDGKDEVKSMSCPSGRNFSGGKDTSILTEWDLVCESTGLSELVGLLYAVGLIVGGLVSSVLADRYGRKWIFLISSVAICFIETAIVFAPNVFLIAALRFMSGMFQEGLNCAGFVLAMELLTPTHRTIYGITECVIWIFCTLLSGAIAFFTQDYGWRGYQIATALLGSFFPLYLLFVKESPRWLANNNRIKDALKVLQIASIQNKKNFIRVKATFLEYVSTGKTSDSDNECVEKRSSLNDYSTLEERLVAEEVNCKTLLCNKSILILTLISSFLWLTHDLTYYGMYMTSSTLSGDRFLNFTLMALTEIPSNVALYVMMLRMGRRKIMAIFLSLASISLLVCSLAETFSEQIPNYGTVSIVFFLLGKFAITSSYNVIYIYTPEIFPTNIRTIGFAACSSVGKIGSLVAPYFRAFYTVATWGPAVTFCAMCFASLFFLPVLPEMKDINLHDTAQGTINSKKKQSKGLREHC